MMDYDPVLNNNAISESLSLRWMTEAIAKGPPICAKPP